MSIRFDSRNEFYKAPFGAVKCESRVTFRITAEGSPSAVYIVIGYEKISMEHESETTYKVVYTTPPYGSILLYHFEIVYDTTVIYGNNELGLGGLGAENSYIRYQLTVYEKNKIPDWVKEAVCYQIFPDRFCHEGAVLCPKPNSFIYGSWYDTPMYIKDEYGAIARWDFFGGNLAGIESKLDYIAGLGVNLIYLNPIFTARSNHRYDTADFMHVDSMLGGDEALSSLITAAHSRGLRIILDGVFNHTGCDSIYFDIENHYGNGAFHNEDSPYRKWYSFKDDGTYDCWWGVGDLPSVNELEPTYMEYIMAVLEKWLKMGIDGWRLDVADELPDEFLYAVHEKCRSVKSNSYVVGEVWENATNKISYGKLRTYFIKPELDGVMNYPFRDNMIAFVNNQISGYELADRMLSLSENYPPDNMAASLTILGSHDSERVLTEVGTVENLKMLSAIQMACSGIPTVYYGDEAGVRGGRDPDNRRTFPWGRENKELTDWYRKIIYLRKSNPVMIDGRSWFGSVGEDVFFVKRFNKNTIFYVFINRSDVVAVFPWNETLINIETKTVSHRSLSINPHEAAFFEVRKSRRS